MNNKIVLISAAIFLTALAVVFAGISTLLIIKGHPEIAYGLIGLGIVFSIVIIVSRPISFPKYTLEAPTIACRHRSLSYPENL